MGQLRQNFVFSSVVTNTFVFEANADGFLPGGASLHNCMTPHGPDTKSYEVCFFLTIMQVLILVCASSS